ncbi:glycosyltransferase family 4 protein [Lewinella cohaerens]|uniref:glycosyltransferase family 4 protein n=1 Tax=Lewinella cohaerens TaxID=70995 RepID=UPI00037FC127|nr:glycosyltransferase family 1 protein [Lewinella cohaerens]
MRIAVNTRLLLTGRLEGIGRFTHEVARRLVERHPQHEFLFLFDRPYDDEFVYADNVKPLVLPPPARRGWLWHLWFEWAIPVVLKWYKADVFLSMDGYCSLRSKVPTVMVSHDIAHVHYPEQIPAWALRFYHKYVPLYLKRAEKVVTVSEFCRQDIHQQYQIPLGKITVACNAPSPSFQPLPVLEKEKIKQAYAQGEDYFFYLGALHPRKNIVRLLEAFASFKQQTSSSLKLLIAGRFAWQTSGIKEAYENSPVKEDIRFLGYVSDEELPRLVASALALTYVSLFEGFGVPLLEAMQAEVPVLTSSVSSLPEVAGDAALLVDPTDISAIAVGMKHLYDSENLRNALVEKGTQRLEEYSWEKAVAVIEAALML